MSFREDNPDLWLKYLRSIGQWAPELRRIAEEHPGVTCHRDLFGGHYWIQVFRDDGHLWLLHGADSTLPGLDDPRVPPDHIVTCDCGRWRAATKEQAAGSRAQVREMFRALDNGAKVN